jgi:hypothetical protein
MADEITGNLTAIVVEFIRLLSFGHLAVILSLFLPKM